ncbi:MAG: TraB/GumN family protein [Saprospiraceae bacterium]|nr:TraB/GumN family protein [Saprospiraceae bacterium]
MKKILLLSNFILFQWVSFAQTSLDKALLWEISGNGLTEKSYLFGTIHMIAKNDFFLPNEFEKSFKSASTLYLELDLNEMSDMGKMMGILEKCYMKDEKKLSDLLSNDDYQVVKQKFEAKGLPIFMFERMKPLFISAMLSMDGGVLSSDQNSDIKSYEFELLELAKKDKKTVKGIESMEFQLSIFDSIPYDVQAKSLLNTLKSETKDADDSLKGLSEIYKSQDLDKMMNVVESSDEMMKPYLNLLLNNRNDNWIPIIKKSMASGPSFFAVGAGHLGGDKGVINLLKKEGYKLKPLK